MAAGREMESEDIAAVAALIKWGRATRRLLLMLVKLCTVQHWTKKKHKHVTSDPGLPTHNKHPGMKPKILPRALQIIKRQLESNPKLFLRQVKEQILVIFGNISPYP